MAKKRTGESELPTFSSMVPELKPGTYEDGTPLHEVQFLECKIILKADHFASAKSFREYRKLVERAAEEKRHRVHGQSGCSTAGDTRGALPRHAGF